MQSTLGKQDGLLEKISNVKNEMNFYNGEVNGKLQISKADKESQETVLKKVQEIDNDMKLN